MSLLLLMRYLHSLYGRVMHYKKKEWGAMDVALRPHIVCLPWHKLGTVLAHPLRPSSIRMQLCFGSVEAGFNRDTKLAAKRLSYQSTSHNPRVFMFCRAATSLHCFQVRISSQPHKPRVPLRTLILLERDLPAERPR